MAKKKEEEEVDGVAEETVEPEPIDKTIPGGAYEVGGKLVNSEGQPISKTGKVKGE